MKKTLIIATFLGILLTPSLIGVRAQTVDTTATSAQVDELKTELISLLTQLITQLQTQIQQIIANQASQQTQIDTIAQNTSPVQNIQQVTTTPPTDQTTTSQQQDIGSVQQNTSPVLTYKGYEKNSCGSDNGTTWSCEFIVRADNANIIIGNDALNSGSITVTKDGSPYTDLSGFSLSIQGDGSSMLKESNGWELSQNDSAGIEINVSIPQTLPSGKYTITINSITWYPQLMTSSDNGSPLWNDDGSPKVGSAQTTDTTDNPSYSWTVQ